MKVPQRLAGAVLLAALHGSVWAAAVEAAVTGADAGPLANAVVFLESKQARAASRPLGSAEIAQQGKQFVQRISVVPVGTPVQFPNRDTVRHHVYSFSPAKTFELKLYIGTPAAPVVFDRPGIAVLGCNIHDSMAAWVVVVETPHHGISGVDGRILLADVPPGSYRLRAWHPALPVDSAPLDQALVVPEGGTKVVLQLPADGTAAP